MAPPPPAARVAFEPACDDPHYPSPEPPALPDIDTLCGLPGKGSGAEAEQNAAKNNFCAGGAARPITIPQMRALYERVVERRTINFGPGNPTEDREPLRRLGEGRLVIIRRAFIFAVRPAGGEGVNCGDDVPDRAAYHDIHISLVEAPGLPRGSKAAEKASECTSVVVEMAPHHRPQTWSAVALNKLMRGGVPVRVTGQLFFDSSHAVCSGGVPLGTNPARSSLWELHPVYDFEVCTSGCNGSGIWVSLDAWVRSH